MATFFQSTAYMSRFSLPGILSYNKPYTMMGWVLIPSTPGSYDHIFGISYQSFTEYDHIGMDTGSSTLRSEVAGFDPVTGSTLALNIWHHIALVRRTPAYLETYLNGILDIVVPGNVGVRTEPNDQCIAAISGQYTLNGYIHAEKEWQRALSPIEIRTEMVCVSPVSKLGLHSWCPLTGSDKENDYGGRYHYSTIGTVSDVAPPTIPWTLPPGYSSNVPEDYQQFLSFGDL